MNIIDVTQKIPICNYSKGRIDRPTGKSYKPEGICLHITGDSRRGQAFSWFQNPMSKVSAHYVVEKNGDILKCVEPENKAYHCGETNKPTAKIYFDKNGVNPNLYLVGVECVSSGEPLTNEQKISLVCLLKYLNNTFQIALNRYYVIGHYELDTVTRKNDPVSSYSVDTVIKKLGVDKMFNDADKISDYAKDAVDNLEKMGIIKGDIEGNFKPLEPITRQDLAVVLNNFLKINK